MMRVAVLASGTGTNLGALIEAQDRGDLLPARIVVVGSNRPAAPALERARRADIPAFAIDHREFATRVDFDGAMLAALAEHRVDAVILAGYMRILSPIFVAAYRDRILNTHPSLLPAFPGKDAPAQALAAGVKVSGCTVHLVDDGVDTGPIVFQAAVKVVTGDDPATLHARIQREEHRLLPKAVKALALGHIICEDRRVTVTGEAEP